MMIATLPAPAPTASQPSSADRASGESSTFASVLNEKRDALPEPSRASACANKPSGKAASATEADAEKSRDADDAELDASLLTMLNLVLPATPDAGEDKDTSLSLTTEHDASDTTVAADGAPPLPLAANLSALPETQPDSAPDTTADATLPVSENLTAVPKNSSRPTLAAHVSAAASPHGGAQQADLAEPALSAAQMPLKPAATVSASTSFTLKENQAARVEEPQGRVQPPHMPLLAADRVSEARASEQAQSSGTLTETMGTPAWQSSLGQQIACFTRNGIQHAELRLHPEELGSLQISLQLKNEQAQLHFVSASHQVRAAIEAAVPHLRTSLAEAGIELGQSSIGAETPSSWQHSGDPSQHARQNFAGQTAQDELSLPEERVENVVRTGIYNSGINTFA